MLKFGKKVNYRPVLVSLTIGLIIGFTIGNIFQSSLLGTLVTILVFLFIFLGYYLVTLDHTFTYWEVDKDVIRYSNLDNTARKIMTMLLPTTMNRLTEIDLHDIDTITIHGSYDTPKQMPFALLYNAYLAIISASISMNRNPMYVDIMLKTGKRIELSMSRDYIYDSKKTFEKIDQLFDILAKTPIKVNNQMKDSSSEHLNLKNS